MANAILLKVNATVESERLSAVLKKYEVVGLPTVIMIEKDGNIRKDLILTGFESPMDFIKRLNKLKTLQ